MYSFDYRCPRSLAEATALLSELEDAQVLAGGHTLLPTMKQRLAAPSTLIDLSRIEELRHIVATDAGVHIGAMATHGDIAESSAVRSVVRGFCELASMIGDPHVRNRGTLGGSLANNDPTADYAAGILALNATIVTDRRALSVDDFFQGLFTTALEEGEIILRCEIETPSAFGYARAPNPASRYALAGVAICRRAADIRVAVTGAGSDGVYRWQEAEEALAADFSAASLSGLRPDPSEMSADIHASSNYRSMLVGQMAMKALERALALS